MNYHQAVLENHEHFDRVRQNTLNKVNQKIDNETEAKIQYVISQGQEAVQQRLNELDREWDIDRVLMLNFSVLVILQLFAARKNAKWLWGPILQTPFLLMQSTVGWCPPSLWFRPMGFRTRKEIQSERDVLIDHLKNLKASDLK
ncbi:MAG: YgaP family membrane protein [Bdellovibrio sp.]